MKALFLILMMLLTFNSYASENCDKVEYYSPSHEMIVASYSCYDDSLEDDSENVDNITETIISMRMPMKGEVGYKELEDIKTK